MDGKFLLRGAQTFSLKEPPNFENFKWSFQRCCQNVNPLDFFLQGMPKKIGGSDSWMFKGRGGGGGGGQIKKGTYLKGLVLSTKSVHVNYPFP